MFRQFCFLSLCGCLAWGISAAQSTTKTSPIESKRFLFVVDTSSAMHQFDFDGRQAMFDMVYTGLSGRMKAGDTFGVWTFNKQLYGGVFPMQVWQPEQTMDLATKTTLFLKEQRYKKKAALEPVMTNLQAVVSRVKDVSVLIVTSGESRWDKTGLEPGFQEIWRTKAAKSQMTKLPVIVTLEAQKGHLQSWSIAVEGEQLTAPSSATGNPVTNTPAVTDKPNSAPAITQQPSNASADPALAAPLKVPEPAKVETKIEQPNSSIAETAQPAPSTTALTANASPISPSSPAPQEEVQPKKETAIETPAVALAQTSANSVDNGAVSEKTPVTSVTATTPPADIATTSVVHVREKKSSSSATTATLPSEFAAKAHWLVWLSAGLFLAICGVAVALWRRVLRRPMGTSSATQPEDQNRPVGS